MQDEEAVEIYNHQLEENQDDLNVRFCLACALFRLEKFAPAQEHFEKLIALDKDSLEAKLSHEWLEKIYRHLRPQKDIADGAPPGIFPLSVYDIVQQRQTSSVVDENRCYFHPDKGKKFLCSSCKKSLCRLCGSLRKGMILCPECVAKGVGMSEVKHTAKMHPLMRGALSGLFVSIFVSVFTAELQNLGLKMILIGYSESSHPSYVVFFLLHVLHLSVVCAVAGASCEYYGKLSFFSCAEFSGRIGLAFGILFSLLIGTETFVEFVVPVFQFLFLMFLSGFLISFVDNTFFIPTEDMQWKR